MRRRSKILLLSTCGLIAVVAVCFFSFRDNEPSYNGRTFSEWIQYYGKIEGTDPVAIEGRREAARAIRIIGTKGVPVLLRKLSKSQRESRYEQAFKHLPHFLHPITESITDRANDDRAFVMMGFGILGTNAACALPELALQFSRGNDIAVTTDAIEAIGTTGLDFFLSVIKAGGTNIQRRAAIKSVARMRDLGTDALRAVPILIDVATNETGYFSYAALMALADLRSEPEKVLPIFTNKLASTNVQERYFAIEALSKFGTNARPAASAIKIALLDDDPAIRLYATNTLALIAPEALTNSARPRIKTE